MTVNLTDSPYQHSTVNLGQFLGFGFRSEGTDQSFWLMTEPAVFQSLGETLVTFEWCKTSHIRLKGPSTGPCSKTLTSKK